MLHLIAASFEQPVYRLLQFFIGIRSVTCMQDERQWTSLVHLMQTSASSIILQSASRIWTLLVADGY